MIYLGIGLVKMRKREKEKEQVQELKGLLQIINDNELRQQWIDAENSNSELRRRQQREHLLRRAEMVLDSFARRHGVIEAARDAGHQTLSTPFAEWRINGEGRTRSPRLLEELLDDLDVRRINRCQYCHHFFYGRREQQYCSTKCRVIHWQKENPDKLREQRQRAYNKRVGDALPIHSEVANKKAREQ